MENKLSTRPAMPVFPTHVSTQLARPVPPTVSDARWHNGALVLALGSFLVLSLVAMTLR